MTTRYDLKMRNLAIGLIFTATFTNADSIILQSTTSTKNSGLYEHLLPIIKKEIDLVVRVVAVGTGQAIKNAERCDGDVLLVHAKGAEEEFVKGGFGVKRFNLMYNDFVIVGPKSDPAKIQGLNDATQALRKIASSKSIFVSRGDDSGTHKAELSLWRQTWSVPSLISGKWYLETGSGMGTTLNIAVEMRAYAITDRATWIKFGNKRDTKILVEGDSKLVNQYGIILVSQKKCPTVNTEAGQKFVAWLLSAEGQKAIDSYSVGGNQLFFANAAKNDNER
ncbi:substrate-binding domain-containing protein [Litorivicinus sp.]|nr:substrate-binding domain-containing protein [Litorivicinus sp.]